MSEWVSSFLAAHQHIKRVTRWVRIPESPARGWWSSPQACTACCGLRAVAIKLLASAIAEIFGTSEGQWPWHWIGSRTQGHLNMHNMCRITSIPNHLTVASRTPKYGHLNFVKCRHSVNSFLERNLKIGSEKLYTRSHTITTNDQFWAPCPNCGGDWPGKL